MNEYNNIPTQSEQLYGKIAELISDARRQVATLYMRRFYTTYEIQQTLSVKLSGSHYCELLSNSTK